VFRLWKLKWRGFSAQRSFDQKEKKLKQEKANGYALAELAADRHYALQDIEDGIDYLRSRKLLDDARSLDVEIPPHSDRDIWQEDAENGVRWLTSKGRAHMRKTIDEAVIRRREVKAWWWKTVIIPAITVLTGLAGALIGVMAFRRK